MNSLIMISSKIDIHCPGCQRPGRLRSRYLGLDVRCKRCGAHFQVAAEGPRLGTSRPVDGEEPGFGGTRWMTTLGVSRPVADERESRPLRVHAG